MRTQLKAFEDSRGILVPIRFADIPFEVKHAFYVRNIPASANRGGHAHRLAHQLLICIQGACQILTLDTDGRKDISSLRPEQTMHIPPMLWCSQHFVGSDGILLVLSSVPYDESDYIRNLEEFFINS